MTIKLKKNVFLPIMVVNFRVLKQSLHQTKFCDFIAIFVVHQSYWETWKFSKKCFNSWKFNLFNNGTELLLDYFWKRFGLRSNKVAKKITKNARFIEIQLNKHFLETVFTVFENHPKMSHMFSFMRLFEPFSTIVWYAF